MKDEEIVTKNNEIADAMVLKTALESSLAEMRVKIEELQKKLADCEAKVPGAIPATGTVYKVQFGLWTSISYGPYTISQYLNL